MHIEYYPWSKEVLNNSLQMQKQGMIPTLDLELTSKCSGACCLYCDSKPQVCTSGQLGETRFSEIEEIVIDAKKHGLKWVYTCGLGEPLEDDKFWNLIHLFKSHDICLSMFSNGVFIKDIYTAKELRQHNVNIILKMDTFNERNFDTILGKKGTANKIYEARDRLVEAGYGAINGYTNLAFSIVPTSLSIDGIPNVIAYCKKHGIFASIGELEQAGEVLNREVNDALAISKKDVCKLKTIADAYKGGTYMRPICPCILTGVHIDNIGNCIVDRDTGLNCKWFLLKDPLTTQLGNIYSNSILDLFDKVNTYRKLCFETKLELIKQTCDIPYVFGGCGGNPKEIIELAISQLSE